MGDPRGKAQPAIDASARWGGSSGERNQEAGLQRLPFFCTTYGQSRQFALTRGARIVILWPLREGLPEKRVPAGSGHGGPCSRAGCPSRPPTATEGVTLDHRRSVLIVDPSQ